MKASRGVPAAVGEILKKCATIGMPQTPDNVVTTAKWDANVMAQPQLASWVSDCRAAITTLFSVLLLCDTGSGFSTTLAKARLARPTAAMNRKHARQPKPVTAAASGVVAMTPPTYPDTCEMPDITPNRSSLKLCATSFNSAVKTSASPQATTRRAAKTSSRFGASANAALPSEDAAMLNSTTRLTP